MAFDITLLGGSTFQLDLTLAPSGKGIFPANGSQICSTIASQGGVCTW